MQQHQSSSAAPWATNAPLRLSRLLGKYLATFCWFLCSLRLNGAGEGRGGLPGPGISRWSFTQSHSRCRCRCCRRRPMTPNFFIMYFSLLLFIYHRCYSLIESLKVIRASAAAMTCKLVQAGNEGGRLMPAIWSSISGIMTSHMAAAEEGTGAAPRHCQRQLTVHLAVIQLWAWPALDKQSKRFISITRTSLLSSFSVPLCSAPFAVSVN